MPESSNLYSHLDATFEQVYIDYYPKVYRCAYFYIKHHEKAEDITQSIFLHLLENWPRLQIEKIENYLFISTKNAVFNEFRSLSVQSRYISYLRERFSEEDGNIEEQAIEHQQQDLLEKAVEKLPARQRLAWRLSRGKGLTYQEVGREMGISKTTVKELMTKALRAVKKVITSLFLSIALISEIFFLSPTLPPSTPTCLHIGGQFNEKAI